MSSSFDRSVKFWAVAGDQDGTEATDSSAPVRRSPARLGEACNLISRLRDISRGETMRSLSGCSNRFSSVAFSSDGRVLAAADDEHTVNLWEVATGRLITPLRGHAGIIFRMVFAPDGRRLASASADRTISVWNVETGAECATLPGEPSLESSVMAFLIDGKMLAFVSPTRNQNGTLSVFDVLTRKVVVSLEHATAQRSRVVFSTDGQWLAADSGEVTIGVWSTPTWRRVATLRGHAGMIAALEFSPDGRTLLSADHAGAVKLWSVRGWKEVASLGPVSYWTRTRFTPDGNAVIASGEDRRIHVWHSPMIQDIEAEIAASGKAK